MSRYSGPQYKGASRQVKDLKREEAEARNAKTPASQRRNPSVRLLQDIFAEDRS